MLGWLHSPVKDGEPRIERIDNPVMPKVPKRAEYIIKWFIDSGMVSQGFDGIGVITWQELQAFSLLGGAKLNEWEADMLRQLSKTYVKWYNKGRDKHCFSPWEAPEDIQDKRARVSAAFRSFSRK